MIKATNDNVLVIREKSTDEIGGITIPDAAKKKMPRGKIITVGKLVSDNTITEGATGIFNKSSGFEIEEDGVIYLVLTQKDIVLIK